MPTKHKRINVTFKPKTLDILTDLSEKNDISLSNITQQLVEQALDFREDVYLSKLAEQIEKRAKGKNLVSADELWKDLNL